MQSFRPRVLAILPGFIPSTMITVIQPLLDLDREGFLQSRITLESLANKGDIHWADLVIFSRNVSPKYQPLMDAILSKGIPFVYDLDDNLFDIPYDTLLGQYHRAEQHQAMMIRYIQHASLMRVYSEVMRQRCLPLNPNTVRVVTPIDWRQIRYPVAKSSPDKIKVVYATSRVDDQLFQVFMPAVERILNHYPGRVEFFMWGSFPSYYRKLPGTRIIAPVPNYNRFLNRFSQSGFDIGLAPLTDDVFHRSKTNNKFREYGACRIAGIYSNVEVYKNCVEHGVNGLLVNNHPEEWYQALSKLIEEPNLRFRIQQQALAYNREHYDQEAFNLVWKNQLLQLLDASVSGPERHFNIGDEAALSAPRNDGLGGEEFSTFKGIKAWLSKFRRVTDRLQKDGPGGVITLYRLYLFPLWLLIKVNVLKKL